jgi:hypothetical protein
MPSLSVDEMIKGCIWSKIVPDWRTKKRLSAAFPCVSPGWLVRAHRAVVANLRAWEAIMTHEAKDQRSLRVVQWQHSQNQRITFMPKPKWFPAENAFC